MLNLNKRMISFSMIPVIIFLSFISFFVLLVFLFFGRASMSANDKLNDMIKYSNQYRSSFLDRTNMLYLYVDSSDVDYYSNYMKESITTGDMNNAKNMLTAIGLEESEKEIITQIDRAWEKYITPAEQNALNKMIQEANPKKAREFISSNEYTSCVKYISDSLKTLGEAIESRLSDEKKTYELLESIFQIIFILTLLGMIAVAFICRLRIERLGIMVENERESQRQSSHTSDVLKRREMRNFRRKRR